MRRLLSIAVILLIAQIGWAATRIVPTSDITYSGAFWGPSNAGNQPLHLGGGINGSSFAITMTDDVGSTTLATVFSPATPQTSATKNPADITNRASVVSGKGWTDITGGRQLATSLEAIMIDLEYLPQQTGQDSAKYYYLMNYYYGLTYTGAKVGWANDNWSSLSAYGLWKIGSGNQSRYDDYMVGIPSEFADAQAATTGYYLGVGRMRNNYGNYGVPLYGIKPWADNGGSPPADQAELSYITLIAYPDRDHAAEYYTSGHVPQWQDGAFVKVGSKWAYVVLIQGYRYDTFGPGINRVTNTTGKWWKSAIPTGSLAWDYNTSIAYKYACYHGGLGDEVIMQDIQDYTYTLPQATRAKTDMIPSLNMLAFYDVDQMAEVAAGTRESHIQPYAYFVLDRYLFNSGATHFNGYGKATGLVYDYATNKLYVNEVMASNSTYEPLIHVLTFADGGGSIDTTPPAPPSLVSVNGSGVVSWTASSEDNGSGNIIYIIKKYYANICNQGYPEYRPIAASLTNSWTDPLYSAGAQYQVVAYDQSMNSSDDYVAQTRKATGGGTIAGSIH